MTISLPPRPPRNLFVSDNLFDRIKDATLEAPKIHVVDTLLGIRIVVIEDAEERRTTAWGMALGGGVSVMYEAEEGKIVCLDGKKFAEEYAPESILSRLEV